MCLVAKFVTPLALSMNILIKTGLALLPPFSVFMLGIESPYGMHVTLISNTAWIMYGVHKKDGTIIIGQVGLAIAIVVANVL